MTPYGHLFLAGTSFGIVIGKVWVARYAMLRFVVFTFASWLAI